MPEILLNLVEKVGEAKTTGTCALFHTVPQLVFCTITRWRRRSIARSVKEWCCQRSIVYVIALSKLRVYKT